jgi:hypothetical protein
MSSVIAQRDAKDVELRQIIQGLFGKTIGHHGVDPRHDIRRPYCCPVSIILEGGQRELPGYTRDLSSQEIGLVHNAPLEHGEVTVALSAPSGQRVLVRTEIRWCLPCRDGRFQSRGRFLGLVQPESRS